MRNICLTLSYDGSEFHGWQSQKNGSGISDTVAAALHQITGEKVKIHGCSRTDTGVHALNYICNFLLENKIEEKSLLNGLNAILPWQVRCNGVKTMDERFHSRYNVHKKSYEYHIENVGILSPFMYGYAWHYKYNIDMAKMENASKLFLGTHDFLGFSATGSSVKTSVRTIDDIEIKKVGSHIKITITADGFLYNMVRIIVGTLVYIGNGKIDSDDVEKIIASRDRKRAGVTAPAKGLFLKEIIYD